MDTCHPEIGSVWNASFEYGHVSYEVMHSVSRLQKHVRIEFLQYPSWEKGDVSAEILYKGTLVNPDTCQTKPCTVFPVPNWTVLCCVYIQYNTIKIFNKYFHCRPSGSYGDEATKRSVEFDIRNFLPKCTRFKWMAGRGEVRRV